MFFSSRILGRCDRVCARHVKIISESGGTALSLLITADEELHRTAACTM
jgi:hypothetical protein